MSGNTRPVPRRGDRAFTAFTGAPALGARLWAALSDLFYK